MGLLGGFFFYCLLYFRCLFFYRRKVFCWKYVFFFIKLYDYRLWILNFFKLLFSFFFNYFIIGNKSIYFGIMLIDVWAIFREYEYVYKYYEVYVTDLILNFGRMYRFVVKFCVIIICYVFLYSDGVLIFVYFFIKG